MKYFLYILGSLILFSACKKDNNTPTIHSSTPVDLQNKTWLFDSSVTVTPDYTQTQYPSSPSDVQTLVFSADTLVKANGANKITYNSYYDGTNLYYWLPGSVDTRSTYWQIVSVSDANLVLKEAPQSDKTVTSYYQVK